MQKVYVFLIIVFYFSSQLHSQDLHLSVYGKIDKETTLLNSILPANTFPNLNSLKKGIDSLQLKLNEKGFINSKLHKLYKKNDSVYTATIHINNKITNAIITYDESIISKSLIASITKNASSLNNTFTIPFENLETVLSKINTELSRNGSPFSKLKLDDITLYSENTVKGKLVSTNNYEKRYLNAIIMKGYEKFPKSYLKHYLRIKKNKIFDIKRIEEKTNALKNLRFANEIKPPEVLFTKDSTTLYVYIEKKQNNAFDGFLGFNTDEKTGNLKLNGFANLELTNNLNYGESLKITYRNDNTEQRSFDSNLTIPYLLNTPFGIELDLNLFRKDSSFTTTQQKANIFYQIAQKHTLSANYKTSESNNLLKADAFSLEDFNTSFYSATYKFINNSRINNFNEYNSSFSLEYGTGYRKINITKTNQQFSNLNAYKIFNLNFNNSILLKISTAILSSDNFTENELLRFGGINSIRGFNENSLYANLFGVINTEYRYKLNRKIYIHSIIDIGHLKNDVSNQKFNLYSFGFGTGMRTKSGVLKFNYANGHSSNQLIKLTNSKIHLSYTTVF